MSNILFNLESSIFSGLHVDIFSDNSDNILQSGITLTEESNRKGVYSYFNTDLSGIHRYLIYSFDERIGQGWANLTISGDEIEVVPYRSLAVNSVDVNSIGGSQNRVTELSNAIDNNYFSRILYNTEYLSGKIYSPVLDEYISGVVSSIISYSNLYDVYVSGKIDRVEEIDQFISGITSQITSYNDLLDSYISGRLNNLSVNISGWLGLQPEPLTGTGFIKSSLNAINDNTTSASTFNSALINNYFERTLLNSEYTSGQILPILNAISNNNDLASYISGNLESFDYSLDLYNSGLLSKFDLYNIWQSGIISSSRDILTQILDIDVYISGEQNNDLDYYISGKLNTGLDANIVSIDNDSNLVDILANQLNNDYLGSIYNLSNYISGKVNEIYSVIPTGIYTDVLCEYISGSVNNLINFETLMNNYISGIINNIQDANIWISGNATYNPSYDIWISGQVLKTFNIYPLNAIVPPRIIATNIYYFIAEEKEVVLEIKDSDGDPVDLTGKNLSLVIGNSCDVQVINGLIDGNKFIFTNEPFYFSTSYDWALRDNSNNEVFAKGKIYIEEAPYVV